MNTSADELNQHIKLLQKFVDLADQASSEKGDNGQGGMIMNSASLEDVPLSETSDNRAQSVLSLHTEEDVDSSPSTPLAKSLSCDGEPSKEELLESLKNSENKMEHLAAEHGYLVGMTDEFKSGLNTIELQLRNKKDNGIGDPMPTTATHTFLQHFLKRLELQEKIEEKLDKRRPLLPKELFSLSDKKSTSNVCESVAEIPANEANRNEYPTNEQSEKNFTPRNYSPSSSNTRTSTPLPSRPTRYDLAKCLAQVSAGLSEQALDLQEERTRIMELQTKVAKQQSEVADAIKLSASTLMRNSLTPTPTPPQTITSTPTPIATITPTPTPVIAPVTVPAEAVLASCRPIPAPRTLKTLDPVMAKNSESDKKSHDEMRKIVTNCKENTDKLNSIMSRLNDLSEIAKDSTKTEEKEYHALDNAMVSDVPTYQAHRPSEPRYCCQGVSRESADIMQNILTSLVESTEIILQQQQKVEEHLNTIKMLNEKLNQKASKDDVFGGSTLYPHTYKLSQPQPQQHKIPGHMAPQSPLDCYNGMPLQPHFSYYMLGPQPQYAYNYPMAPQPQFAYTNHMAPQPQYAFNSGMTSPPALYNPYQPNVDQPLPQYIHLPEQYQRPQQNVMLGHQSQIHYPSIGEYHYAKHDDENDKN